MKTVLTICVGIALMATSAMADQPHRTGLGKLTAAQAGGQPSGRHVIVNPAQGKFITGIGKRTAAMVQR